MRVYPSIETQKRIEELESSNAFSLGSAGSCSGSGVVAPLAKADGVFWQSYRTLFERTRLTKAGISKPCFCTTALEQDQWFWVR